MKKIYFSIVLVLMACILHAQKDTLFWFAAPETSSNFSNFDIPIVMRITTYSQAATVTISQPAGTLPPQTVTIGASSTQTVDLSAWLNIIETTPADMVLNYGLMVQSTVPVSVYYEVVSSYCNCNPEMFVLKGHNALGTDFYVPGQNFMDNNSSYNPLPYNSFDIVATQDNTTVTITPTNAVVGHAAGTPYNVVMNHGQVYSATATGELAAQHLVGSRVTSDKPVAITMKDDLLTSAAFGSCADLGGDQIVPTNILGTEYIASNGLLNGPGDQLFITATQNGTAVSQNGTLLTTINAGQTYQTSVGGTSTLIQTSNPAYVAQLSGIGCEIGLGVLPPLLCTGSFEVAFTRSTTEPLYTNIAVPSGFEGNFLVNGVAGYITAAMFAPVPGTGGGWVAAQVLFPNSSYPQGTAIRVSNSTSLFRLGVLHGGAGSGSRFGYFSDFSQVKVAAVANANDVCSGSTIQFTTDTVLDATYSWTGPNGFTSTLQNPSIPNAPAADSGLYFVTASFFGCVSKPDTVDVNVHANYIDTITAFICYPKSYTLPDGSLVSASGNYLAHLTTIYGCDSSVITKLTVPPPPVRDVYDSICYGQHFILPSGVAVNSSGIYTDTLNTPQGCDSVVINYLTVIAPPVGNVADTVCYGQKFTLPSGIVVDSSGVYVDTLSPPGGCDSVVISAVYFLPINLTAVYDTICYGLSYTRPTGTVVNATGLYRDTLISARGCDSIIVTNLLVQSLPVTALKDTICAGQVFARPSGLTETLAGIYTDTLHTGTSCDSVVIHSLTVIQLNLSASTQGVLCYGQSNGVLIALGDGGVAPYHYNLYQNGVLTAGNNSGTFQNLAAGNYVLGVTDDLGCTDTALRAVAQPDSFQLTVSKSDITCYGKHDGSISILAAGGFPQFNYILNSLNSVTGNFSQLDTGQYMYLVTDAHGCVDSGQIGIQQPQEIIVSMIPDSAVMQLGQSLQINASSNYDPNAGYRWSPAYGLSCYSCPSPVADLNSSTIYTLAVSVNVNGNDCVKDTALSVTVIPDYDLFIPNTFTPNADGKNDYFQLFGKLNAIEYIALQIFDRLGEKVFDSNDPYFKWDGTYKGKPLEPTVLTYTLRVVFDDGHMDKLYRGSLTLLR